VMSVLLMVFDDDDDVSDAEISTRDGWNAAAAAAGDD